MDNQTRSSLAVTGRDRGCRSVYGMHEVTANAEAQVLDGTGQR